MPKRQNEPIHWILGCLLVGVFTCPALGATDYYVDANADSQTPDGLSWCAAFPTLQDALDVVVSGDSILVAAGTYYPDPTGLLDPRDASFELASGTRIKGGYAGCGAVNPDERDTLLYETILSGDLNGDDDSGGSSAENSYHVVFGTRLASTTTVDGVTISGGHANGSSLEGRGGGVFLQQGSLPSFLNCRIVRNYGIRGAGMFNLDSSPFILNSVIAENESTTDGGGLRDAATGQEHGSTLINCLLRDNVAGGFGGAMRTDDAGTTLKSCTVVNNRAQSGAGGLWIVLGNPVILNSIFWGNTGATDVQRAQIGPASSVPNVSFTCVEGWDGTIAGTNSFPDDPLFAVGPLGCFYLSHILAGESADSSCLDAGNAVVDALLANRTTRSDVVADTGLVDLGYHYPMTADVLIMGDYDRDEVVDLSDYGAWVDCVTGPIADELTDCCRIADFDDDEDIDLLDLADFANALTAP